MAKKLHPLDVRYTGPSTAYVGKPKRKHDMIRVDDAVPVVLPEPAAPDRPATRQKPGPWGQTASPPPPPKPGRPAPPPLPIPTAPALTATAAPRRRSGLRVVLILGAIIVIVAVSNMVGQMAEPRMFEMPTSNRDAFNL